MNACPKLFESYSRIIKWYDDYSGALQTLKLDHEFLCAQATPPNRIWFALDVYDVIAYCFPFLEDIDKFSGGIGDEEFRRRVFRLHAARACLFYGLPSGQPVILLPPHHEELNLFLRDMQRDVKGAIAEKEFLDLLLPSVAQVEQALKTLEAVSQVASP